MNTSKSIIMIAGLALAGSASAQTYSEFYGVALPDDDPTGVSVTLNVPDSITIADLNVGLGITHTWQGDLIVELTSPSGTTVGLLHRAGDGTQFNGGAGGGFGFSNDNFGDAANDTLFYLDDSAAEAYDAAAPNGYGNLSTTGGIDNVTGSWLPFDAGGITSLADFNGENAQGDWTLFISDNAGGDLGTFDTLSLEFTAVPAPASLALLGLGGLATARRRR